MLTSHIAPLSIEKRRATVGAWCPQLRTRHQDKAASLAQELEALEFSAIWIPGGTGGSLFEHIDTVLDATRAVLIATGVLNMLMHEVHETADWAAHVEEDYPGRLLLGLGASHAKRAAAAGKPYEPIRGTQEYLDHLDSSGSVPPGRRLLGALGPGMLKVARERTAGAHTYIVTPDHTRTARSILGPDRFLCPVVKVAVESTRAGTRELARAHLAAYLSLSTYSDSLRRMGFTSDDFAGGGSTRMVDALVSTIDSEAILEHVTLHLQAGANHVCIQPITADRQPVPLKAWERISSAVADIRSDLGQVHGHE